MTPAEWREFWLGLGVLALVGIALWLLAAVAAGAPQ